MTTLWLDLETFSECDLKAHGTHRYASDPSTEIIMAQWAIDDGEPVVEDLTGARRVPSDALYLALANATAVVAHNSVFDRTLIRHCWGMEIPVERWRDTMVKAYAHGLPGSLGKVGEVLGLPLDQQKDRRGTQLIGLFCKPRPKGHTVRRATRETHPAEWAEFCSYGHQDIVAMREIDRRLPSWNYRESHQELALWHLDQRVNDRGFAVDLPLAVAAIDAVEQEQRRLKKAVQDATLGEVSGPSKRDDMLRFILEAYGVELPDFKADTLRRRLEDPELPDGVKLLINLRLEATKTSTAKYKALVNAVSADGRLRNTSQFAGAQRTARWAHRLFQPGNMPRPNMQLVADGLGVALKDLSEEDTLVWQEAAISTIKAGTVTNYFDDVMGVTSNLIRGCIVAPPGRKLCVADLSNIEGRGLAELAGEEWKLKAFAAFDAGTGADLYKLAYARSFNVDPATATGQKRQIGKVMELGLGYEGGVAAFLTFAAVYQMDLAELADAVHTTAPKDVLAKAYGMWEWATRKRRTLGLEKNVYVACEALKAMWRSAHPATVALWEAAGEGVRSAIANPGVTFDIGPRLKAQRDGAWLRVRLPSGRYLCYLQPQVADDGQISYMGVNQYTRQWSRIKTYGGKLIENCLVVGTPVLTERGPVPIEQVRGERVWDGVEWVRHSGLKYSGKQATITVCGVGMTPDHRVLTTEGWRRASSCQGLDRAHCRLPDRDAVPGQQREEVLVGRAVLVWPHGRPAWHGTGEAEEAWHRSLMRLYAAGHHRPQENHTWDVQAPSVRGVAQHDRPLPAAIARGVEELRRAWHHGVRAVAGGVRQFLGRHGPDVPARPHAGAQEQQPRLFARELRLAHVQGAGQQHPAVALAGHPGGAHDCDAGRGALPNRLHDAALQVERGVGDQPRAVYDLLDCGPRRRFAVVDPAGKLMLVHNCTQAWARDVLAYNMPAIDAAGYEILVTIHDELLTETPDTDDYTADTLAAMMSRRPPWAPTVPLAAAGFETDRYRKG